MRPQEHSRFWSFWLERILPKKEIRGPFNAKVRHIDQNDPVPPETAHPGSPIELSAHYEPLRSRLDPN